MHIAKVCRIVAGEVCGAFPENVANLARGCLRNLGSDPGTAPLPTSFSYTQDAKAHWKIDMGFLMI